MYVMLCGYPPFYAESDADIFKKILIGNFSFRGAEWRGVSNSAKDLIRNMLIANTDLRMNASQVLEHPWLQTSSADVPIPISPLRILQYKNSTMLRKAALLCIASHCNDQDIQAIREAFVGLDTEARGCIKIAHMHTALSDSNKFELLHLLDFVKAMDLNYNGSIEYSEFIAAAINSDIFLSQQRLLAAFQIFDKNENGKVSVDDIQGLVGKVDKKKQAGFQEVMNEVNMRDASGLSFEEFSEIVTSNKLNN